jgi:VRR-NUC domain
MKKPPPLGGGGMKANTIKSTAFLPAPQHKPRHNERSIQVSLIEHLRLRGVRGLWWSAINSNPRSRISGALAKAAGCRAGIPDLLLARGGQLYGIELKAPKGRLSAVQKAMHAEMTAAGVSVATCVGLDAAIAQLETWALLKISAPQRNNPPVVRQTNPKA